jgi:hypothetical protein
MADGRNGEEGINPYTNEYGKAGDEISSTSEGRHVLILESILVHPAHSDGFVDKGDPVAFWDGVGVALKSAQSAAEFIPVDTEGIWRLSVTNTGATNWGSVLVGQTLFITGAGVLVDDWTQAYAIFGYALEPIAAPSNGSVTALIAVKVHWMYPYWYYDTGQ